MNVRSAIKDHPMRSLLIGVGAVAAALVLVVTFQVWNGLSNVPQEDFSPDGARQAFSTVITTATPATPTGEPTQLEVSEAISAWLETVSDDEVEHYIELAAALASEKAGQVRFPTTVSPRLPDEMFNSYLLIGADQSGFLADVIIYVMVPSDGSRPILTSIPRDLYVVNPCTGLWNRINTALNGCKGVASGPEMLSVAVEDFTGVGVDHFVKINFNGFKSVVDTLGGIRICVNNQIRDIQAHLELDAGCHQAGGDVALAWVRGRHTQQLVDGQWVPYGSSDFARQKRQQDVLFQIAGKIASFGSITQLGTVAQQLSSSVRVDRGFSMAEAIQLAWSMRGIDKDQVSRLSVEFANFRTDTGAAVLLPVQTFNSVLAAAYPPAAVS